ncbi:MAG TPA: BACON domain-containing protein, partial [Ignavibacteriaceae bacterium]|nr:BACON domain-containing protein [Ignavibacteriaceae bacterium]
MKKYLLLEMMIASFLFFSNDLMAQTLLVKPSLQIVQDKAGQTLFIITSDINWEVEVDDDDDDWLEVNPTSGFGNDTLIATFEKNDDNQQRTVSIEVEGGGITRTVTVTQLKKNAIEILTVLPANKNVGAPAGSTTFDVTSNVTWMVSDDAEWLTVTPEFGINNMTLTATYEANTTTSQRVGTITVTGGGITRTVTVTQAAVPFTLTVTPSNRDVPYTAGNTTFTVTSNTNWTVSDDAEWLTISPVSGTGDGTLTATYTENTTTSQRVGTITVTGGGITRTVTVTQSATAFTLTVTPQNQSVTNAPGSTEFTVQSKTNWTVSDDAAWLTVSPVNGTGNGAIIASYEENTTTTQRVGTITVTGGGITRT